MSTALNIADFEAAARARMEPSAFDYYAGGAGDELSLKANRGAFAEVWFNAAMEGKINGEFFYATVGGRTDNGLRPIPFEGFLRGQLGAATATGDWECEVRFSRARMSGNWEAKQGKTG